MKTEKRIRKFKTENTTESHCISIKYRVLQDWEIEIIVPIQKKGDIHA